MKTASGAFRSGSRKRPASGGYSLLGFFLVAFGLTVVSIVVATNMLGRVIDQNRRDDQSSLNEIHRAFVLAVRRTQTIPTYTNWESALAPFTTLNPTGLDRAQADWGSDSTLTRAFLVDPNLPSSVLPYVQPATGVSGSATNLLRSAARVLIVSGSKRGLALPVSSGVVASNTFNAIWDWRYDASTKSPPTGWTNWTKMGEFLQVDRINLANLFTSLDFADLKFGVSGAASVTNLVTTQATYSFLQGTPLVLAATNGAIKATHVVNAPAAFDFSVQTNTNSFVYYAFTEKSGTVATNSGGTGSSANGVYMNGVRLAQRGPRPPTFRRFASNNRAVRLDGSNDYVKGTNGLLDNASGFSILGWIKPSTASTAYMPLFGQQGIAEVVFGSSSSQLQLRCANGAQVLSYNSYPYSYRRSSWHFIAAVGDGTTMYLYLDGTVVASRAYATANYGSYATDFNVGGNVSGTSYFFRGYIDEVMAFNRALSSTEISSYYR